MNGNPGKPLVVALGIALASFGCDNGGRAATAAAPEKTAAAEVRGDNGCGQLPNADDLTKLLKDAPGLGEAGGLGGGRKMWGAVVDRSGRICAVVTSSDDATDGWPGSRAIAMSKAYTTNAFSTDQLALSTARLYTLNQPGHSLWGLAAGNPFDPACLQTPADKDKSEHRVCGGTIVFGGGVPLYRGGVKVGGLGVSGDTACADHEIAKRVRDKAGLNPAAGALADDIMYSKADKASVFTHPLCLNTWRNGQKIGDEAVSAGY